MATVVVDGSTVVLDPTVVSVVELDEVLLVDDDWVVVVVGSSAVLVVGSAVVVVVGASVVVVVGASVVLALVLDVVAGASVVVGALGASSGSSTAVSSAAGPMLPRPSRSFSTMPGSSIDVDDSGVVSGTVLPPICAAGFRCCSKLTASSARGAATAAAVTVDSDSASQNRPRPVVSPGRCRYIYESELRG